MEIGIGKLIARADDELAFERRDGIVPETLEVGNITYYRQYSGDAVVVYREAGN